VFDGRKPPKLVSADGRTPLNMPSDEMPLCLAPAWLGSGRRRMQRGRYR
jgi:hypothetical protein